jgi:glycosyltransferase involved in cell wall biosynthesis
MFVLNDMRLDSRVYREAATLATAGYEVTVYAVMSQATSHLPHQDVEGFSIVRVPMLMRPSTVMTDAVVDSTPRSRSGRAALASVFLATRPMFGGTLHFLANWQMRWSSWARRVERQVAPADVWHAHDFNTLGLATACARRHGGSVVYDSHEIFTEAGANSLLPGAVRAAMRKRERSWASRASAVLTVNESVADVLHQALGVEARVVRNCSAPPPPGTSPLRDRIGVSVDVDVVMYHGSVTIGRGLEPLIDSMSDPRLGRAHLVIMGYGPLRPAIQALADRSSASDRIHLLPPVPPADVTHWVAGADVAAMPIQPTTLNHRLSSPNKLFEAIAAGVPVVGPDFPEFRRIVLEGRWGLLGRLHADHEPTTIAGEVHALLSLGGVERDALRARCREAAADRWNWQAESRHLLDAYARLAPAASLAPRPAVAHPAPMPLTDE